MDTCSFVLVVSLEVPEGLGCADIRYSAARDESFLNCGTGCIEGILHPVFLLLHLDLGCGAHIEDCHSAGELAETLLKFLPVIVRSCSGNLLSDEVCPLGDVGLVAGSVDDGSIFLGDDHFLCLSEHVRSSVLESEASFF